ncbi:UPF0104 family protein [Nonomuraea ferruginea]
MRDVPPPAAHRPRAGRARVPGLRPGGQLGRHHGGGRRDPAVGVAGAFAAVLLGQFCMLLAWRQVLAGLGSPLPVRTAGRIMFVGQMGKYIPGAIWAYAAMMDLGRDHGSPPRRTFACISLALVINLGVGIAIAAATLATQEVVRQAWYLLLLLPVIAVCMHPKILTWGGSTWRCGWPAATRSTPCCPAARSWSRPPGRCSAGSCTGSTRGCSRAAGTCTSSRPAPTRSPGRPGCSRSWCLAGVGVREGALVLVLHPILGTGPALAVAVVSRLVFTLADVTAAGLAFLLGRQPSRVAVYEAQNGSGSTALTPDRNLSGSPEA